MRLSAELRKHRKITAHLGLFRNVSYSMYFICALIQKTNVAQALR